MSSVNVTVTINASGAQAGAQAFTNSMTQMSGAVSSFSPQLSTISNQMTQLIGIVNQLSQANTGVAGTFAAFAGASLAVDAIREFTDALKELIVESTLYAARTQELGIALDAVAKASGANTLVIAQQEFAMRQLNITTQDARNVLTKFIQTDLDLNKSGALARTAQDLAVIAGVSTSEEINKLIIGIQTLQSRNLRTAGVFLTVDEVLDRLAHTTNRARDSFSTFEKQQAVLNAVLEFGARVTGTYEAAMTTASKQIRSMERLIFEAQNSIGNLFIPVLERVVTALSEMFVFIQSHPKTFLELAASVAAVSTAFVIANTNLVPFLFNLGRMAILMTANLLNTIPLVNIDLIGLAASLGATGEAAAFAATGMGAFQVALGGFFAVIGIIGLISGLVAVFGDLEGPTEKFVKITDTQILQSTGYIKSLQERTKALEQYKATADDVNKSPVLVQTVPLFQSLDKQNVNTADSQEQVGIIQKHLSELRGEEAQLNEKISAARGKDVLTEAENLYKLTQALAQNNIAQDVNSSKLRDAIAVDQKNQQERKQTIDVLKQLTNSNGDLISKTAEVSSKSQAYSQILEKLTPNEKAARDAHLDRADALNALIQGLDSLKQQEASVLAARLSGLASNVRLTKQESQTQTDSINSQTQELTKLQAQLTEYHDLIAKGQQVKTEDIIIDGQATKIAFDLKDAYKTTQDQVDALNKAIADNGGHLEDNQGKLAEQYRQIVLIKESYGGSTEELYNLLHGLQLFPGTLDEFNKGFDEATQFLKGFKDQADKVALGINDVAEQIKNIKFPAGKLYTPQEELGVYVNNLEKQRQAFIDDIQRRQQVTREAAQQQFESDPETQKRFVLQFQEGFKKTSEFIRKEFGNSVGDGLDAALKQNAFDDEGKVKKQYLGLFQTFDAIEKAAKKAARDTKSEFERMTETLERTEEQIKSFLTAGSTENKLRIKLEDSERVKKDLEAIFTLRYKLGVPLDIPIERKNIQSTRAELEILAKVFDQIKEANNAYLEARLKVGAPLIPAEVQAATALLKLTRDRREEEEKLSADIAVAINKRIQLETKAADTRRLQAQAYLDQLNEEQKNREDLVTAVTKLQISRGDFSFADQNTIIQKGLEVANDPVVKSINDTNATIEKSAKEIQGTQVDFSKAFGDNISSVSSILMGGFGDSTKELKNHTSAQDKTNDLLTQIRDGLPTTSDGSGSYYDPTTGVLQPKFNSPTGSYYDPTTGKMQSSSVSKHILSKNEIAGALKAGGWPDNLIPIMVAIGMAESSGNASAFNPRGKDTSLGLFQINQQAHGNRGIYSDANLYDPIGNARAALEVFKKQGFAAWSTFTSGAFRKYQSAISAFQYGIDTINKNVKKTAEASDSGLDITQGLKGIGKVLTLIGNLRDLQTGKDKTFQLLGLQPTPENLDRYTNDPNFAPAATKFIQDTKNRETDIKQRRLILEFQQNNIKNIAATREEDLKLARQESLFNQIIKVQVDDVIELANAESDLNRLRTDGIAIAEELHAAALDRIKAEQEAQKQTIRLQDEQNYRANPDNRGREVQRLLQDEFNARWKAEQDLEDKIAILEHNRDVRYTSSVQFRERIEREAYANRLQQSEDLDKQIIQAEDNLAHQEDLRAKEYRLVWLQAITAVRDAHANAVKDILQAQAQIADQSTYDTERVRARVLDSIKQIENVSDSVGNLFIDTFKVYTDDIDKWIDKTTEKMGNLGKIFNNFFKSIAHRLVGNIEKTILDAIFPPSAEEQAAKKGSVSEGVDKTEQSFRDLAASTVALSYVNKDTGNITIQTASSLSNLANSANVASQSLLNIANVIGSGGSTGLTGGGGNPLTNIFNGGGLSNIVSSLGTGTGGAGNVGGFLGSILNQGGSGVGGAVSRGLSGLFGGGSAPLGGILNLAGSGHPAFDALLAKMANQPLSTTDTIIPTLSGAAGSKPGILGQLGSLFGIGGQGGLGSLLSKAGLKNFGMGIAAQAPTLGLGLGASLGGSSLLGNVLGGLGGLIGGGAVGAFTGTGIFATGGIAAEGGALSFLPALLTNPFTIAIGAGLLVGAYFLGKKKQRQKDEKTRDELKGDAFAQIDQILKNVRNDRMDGIDGITQAESIRDSYFTQMAQVKTGSVRKSAENYRPYFEAKIEAIRREADKQLERKNISDKLVPEFALGGWVHEDQIIKVKAGERIIPPAQQMALAQYGGIVGGQNRGFDDTYMFAQAGTYIQPSSQVPNRPSLSVAPISGSYGSNFGGRGDIIITADSISVDAEGIVFKGLKSNTNQKVIYKATNQAISNRDVQRRF